MGLEQFVVPDHSCMVVCNMIHFSVSSVCYLRDLFAEHCFSNSTPVNDLELKELQNVTPSCSSLLKSLDTAYAGIEQGAVSSVIFTIHEDSSGAALEEYWFDIVYGVNTHVSIAQVESQGFTVLSSFLALLNELPPLDKPCYVSVRLAYTESAPGTDLPPFRPVVGEETKLLQNTYCTCPPIHAGHLDLNLRFDALHVPELPLTQQIPLTQESQDSQEYLLSSDHASPACLSAQQRFDELLSQRSHG